ncbi:MAG TPA: DUF2271 domain-containing protein [Caulobacteraceae bacterium]|jgi:hypothetical protein
MIATRTWLAATFLISAAFVQPALAADADAPPRPTHEGQAFASTPGGQARIVEPDGRTILSDGKSDLIAPASIAQRRTQSAIARLIHTNASAARGAWPAGFVVDIDYAVPQLSSDSRRAPSVGIWITDQEGKSVRTLRRPGDKPSRASGQAGGYGVLWDGKDDAGARLGVGRYAVNIETTGEHGGRSLQTIPIDLGRTPVSASAQGDSELGPATVRYGRPTV